MLGGLLGGPFGAIWGSQLGSSIGAARAEDRANEERLEQMGLSKEVRQLAAACAAELAEAEEGLQLAQRALESAKGMESQLQAQAAELYEAAQTALIQDDEAKARQCLVERQEVNTRVTAAGIQKMEADDRVNQMQSAVEILGSRAAQLEARMSSAILDKQTTVMLEPEDPLLRKFRELED